uniref:Uncharacterized protein n=1 Tax=Brugia malayi TaxID=6279 RepID=A0A5S6P9Q9_BRUMA
MDECKGQRYKNSKDQRLKNNFQKKICIAKTKKGQ